MKKGSCRMFRHMPDSDPFFVRVMAVDGIWVMVRRPGKMPFVANMKQLSLLTDPINLAKAE